MARIAVGGFQHETNTFSPVPATFAEFEAPDAWPGLTRGPALFEAVAGINLPAAGFVQEARSLHHELVPLAWCSAQPSGRVTRDAFERISAMLLEDLRACGQPRCRLPRPARCDGGRACRRCGRRTAAKGQGRRRRGRARRCEPRLPREPFARDGTIRDGARVVSHVPPCGHGRVRCAGGACAARHPARRAGRELPRAGRLPDPAHLAVDAGGSAAIPDARGRGRRAGAPRVARHPAGISGCRRGRVRALGVRLRQRRVSTGHDGPPAGGRTAAPRRRIRAGAVHDRAGDRGDPAIGGAARSADHPRGHAGQSRGRWSRGHDEPDQGAGGVRSAQRPCRRHLRSGGGMLGLTLRGRVRRSTSASGRAPERRAKRHSPLASRWSRSATAGSPARARSTGAPVSNSARWRCSSWAVSASPSRAASSRPRTRRCFATCARNRRTHAVLALKSSVHFRADFGPIAEPRPRRRGAGTEHRRSGEAAVSQAQARACGRVRGGADRSTLHRWWRPVPPTVHRENQMRRILVAIDGSETALRAIDFAVTAGALRAGGGTARAERPADAEQLHRGGNLRDCGAHPPGRHRARTRDTRHGGRAT